VRLYAFLAKYGHQQRQQMLGMTMNELSELASAIGDIMSDEKDNFERQLSGDI
jgi:hypothetical protein